MNNGATQMHLTSRWWQAVLGVAVAMALIGVSAL
jgi:hypothetical protein